LGHEKGQVDEGVKAVFPPLSFGVELSLQQFQHGKFQSAEDTV
jgi:hypothetical protein